MLGRCSRGQLQLEHEIGVVAGGGEVAFAFHGTVDRTVVKTDAFVLGGARRRSKHRRE